MYCSGCGFFLAQGQAVCPQCGRAAAPAATAIPGQAIPGSTIPGYELQLTNFNSQMRVLSVAWFLYAGLTLLLGLLGLALTNAIFNGHFPFWANGPWVHGPWSDGNWPMAHSWIGLVVTRLIGVVVIFRAGLAFAAGWGLRERAPWGRVVAIVASIFNMLPPRLIGSSLGIWTLIALLGYRNSTLYEQVAVSH